MPRDAVQLHPGDPDGPLRRLRLREVEAGGRGAVLRLRGGDWGQGPCLPFPEPVREMVPSELQLGRGDVLQQHRERPPHTGQRPFDGARARVHRRPRGRDGGRPRRKGAPLRVRRAQPCRGGGRPILLRACVAQGHAGRDRRPAPPLRRTAGEPGDSRDSEGLLRQETVLHLSLIPPEGEGRLPSEDERRREGQLHRNAPFGEMRSGEREHLETRRDQGAALAQHQVGVLHRRERPRPDTAAQGRLRRGDRVRGLGRGHPGRAHAARIHAQHHQPQRHREPRDGDVGERGLRPGPPRHIFRTRKIDAHGIFQEQRKTETAHHSRHEAGDNPPGGRDSQVQEVLRLPAGPHRAELRLQPQRGVLQGPEARRPGGVHGRRRRRPGGDHGQHHRQELQAHGPDAA